MGFNLEYGFPATIGTLGQHVKAGARQTSQWQNLSIKCETTNRPALR
jgi:hypothetical protein